MRLSSLFLLPTTSFCLLSNAYFPRHARSKSINSLFSTIETNTVQPTKDDLDELKAALVFVCARIPKASRDEVMDAVQRVESLGEQIGIGQASSSSGLLSGEWELLYCSDDETRTSPFFWALRKAFPDNADDIFKITDAIPAPIKEVGPTVQSIDLPEGSTSGSFVSKVKVKTFNGFATSTMTTKASILGIDGVDGIRLKIDTTKPEGWTMYERLFGPFGSVISENAPAFPSGDVLEQAKAGSSEVILRTTFCDEGIRISRNDDSSNDIFIWKRKELESEEML